MSRTTKGAEPTELDDEDEPISFSMNPRLARYLEALLEVDAGEHISAFHVSRPEFNTLVEELKDYLRCG